MATPSNHIGYPNSLAMSRFGQFQTQVSTRQCHQPEHGFLVHAGSDNSGLNAFFETSTDLKHVNYVKSRTEAIFQKKKNSERN